MTAQSIRGFVGVATVVLLSPLAARSARADEPITWTPQYAAGDPIPTDTKNDQFWPILLERLCTTDGKPRKDRSAICKDGKKTPGKLPVDPKDALSRISTFLDNAILNSVQVAQENTKVIPLKKQTLDGVLSMIQPANDATPGTQGTPAQTDAVPSIQPVSQTAVNAALAGTRAGERVFASVALNPAGLFTTATNDPAAQEAGTKATRLADLSLVLPINPAGSTPGTGGLGSFDYVGVRLRVNATLLFDDTLYKEATNVVDEAFKAALQTEDKVSAKVDALLASFDPSNCAPSYTTPTQTPSTQCSGTLSSKDVADAFGSKIAAAAACAEAIATAVPAEIETRCGQALDVFDTSRKAEAALHGALATLRDQHDANYIGLDARYDFGDPTFSGLPTARGSHLLAALALGHRFLFPTAGASRNRFFGVKSRVGYQLTSLNDNMDRTGSLDFAGGIEVGIISNLQVFKLSAGAEGRHTWSTVPTAADTNFVDIKIGLEIPQSDGTRLGALLSLPAAGAHGTTLSLVGNWSALAGALAPH